ncbi:sodium bile acid symporter family-domain-containing protein [Mycena rosella]|uniref:Sodium bile acid symporter family-domain-containing protein n=1 Tax=Mycena rosella TaxID=1033263 RepID=A0AAD7CSC3_MYCRO|nr:sodium bile acid symporter family-domain-containing protein [Mycena rosella]
MILDRLLSPAILVAMIVGVLIAFDTARFHGVFIRPLLVIHSAATIFITMWPVLTKVQYETMPQIFRDSGIWVHIGISLFFNWIVGSLVMVGLAWATLSDLPTYRVGVIMVGLARCIAMVLIWCQPAKGDANYCAILDVINSVLQIILYSTYTLLFVNVIGSRDTSYTHLDYGNVAISVLIYLGITLVAGIVTRYTVWYLTSKAFLEGRFLRFGPFTFLGLLYTILVMFAYQGYHIVHNIGPVFRVFVPVILYFVIMWTSAFGSADGTKTAKTSAATDYTFKELAIAVTITTYGVGSDEVLAATIGPLVEVPVLVSLTWAALYLQRKLKWTSGEQRDANTNV